MMSEDQSPTYPGIRRFGYFAGSTLVAVGTFATVMSDLPPVVALIFGAVVMALISESRLRNLGMSPAWAWLSFVPFANWILWARCQIFPEGYDKTKKMDEIARVLIGLVFVVVILVFVLIIAAAILGD